MSLLEMSFSGAVMILAIVVLRALALHKLPKRTFMDLWGVVLVRLLVPYSLPFAFSVYSLAERLAPKKAPFSPSIPVEPALSQLPTTIIRPGTEILSQGRGAALPAVDPWAALWLVGALACGAFFTAAYMKCRREFQASLPVDNEPAMQWLAAHRLLRPVCLRQSDRISAPLTYGVFRPVILLPKTTNWSDETSLAYVLEHEYVHICRFDALTKLALTLALCIHWFDPMVWVMYVLANRDMELSCDEAVLRRFGESTRAAYAMALIRMEETRSGPRPLCSNFCKFAIEERTIAIMKTKRTTWLAALTALALVIGMTAAFATSGQAPEEKPLDDGLTQTLIREQDILSYTSSKDGKTYYSTDGGKTWKEVTDGLFSAPYGWNSVEWWTEEEYAAWLEQEKADLRSIIGERGWNPTDGWYTWTQELVDEAIARYEQTLKDIRAGQKVSKPAADGDTMIMFGYAPDSLTSVNEATTVFGSAEALDDLSNVSVAAKRALTPELLADYQAHGVTYDKEKDAFYFDGKLVRLFFDGYSLDQGEAVIYEHVSENGVVDVYTVRQAIQNANGSTDPGGKLVEIKACSQEEFDNRVFMTPQMAETSVIGFVGGHPGTTFPERFARYKDLGITYVEADGASGRRNVYWNGKLVSKFWDLSPDGGAFTFTSSQEGGLYVQTVYNEQGKLTGVEEMLPEAVNADKEAQQYAQDEARRDYEQAKELLAPYFAFGLDCQMDPDTGDLTMTWQGTPVRRFFDPERGIFVANSLGDGGLGPEALSLEAVYDASGRLTGLKEV